MSGGGRLGTVARIPDPDEAEFVRRVPDEPIRSAEPGRHRARRSAMMLLYRSDLMKLDVDDAVAEFQDEHGEPLPEYGAELARGVAERLPQIDDEIRHHLDEWSLDRLGAVERAVLRLAMYELLAGTVPGAVVVDEAVELAKRYASPEAAKLVNGVLGGRLREAGGTA